MLGSAGTRQPAARRSQACQGERSTGVASHLHSHDTPLNGRSGGAVQAPRGRNFMFARSVGQWRCFTSSPPSAAARCNSRPHRRHCSDLASRASSAAASSSTAATCCGSAHPSSRKISRWSSTACLLHAYCIHAACKPGCAHAHSHLHAHAHIRMQSKWAYSAHANANAACTLLTVGVGHGERLRA